MADKPNQNPVDATRQHYRLATGKGLTPPPPSTPKTPA